MRTFNITRAALVCLIAWLSTYPLSAAPSDTTINRSVTVERDFNL